MKSRMKYLFSLGLVFTMLLMYFLSNQYTYGDWHWTKYKKWNCCEAPDWLNQNNQTEVQFKLQQSEECEKLQCIEVVRDNSRHTYPTLNQTVIQVNSCAYGSTCVNYIDNVLP